MHKHYYDGISIQNRREENMDGLFLSERIVGERSLLLSVICDGVGSTKDGAFAARTAIRLLNDWLDTVEFSTRLGLQLRDKVLEINGFITKEAGMRELDTASTLSALLLVDAAYYIVHLGDSRIYSYENGTMMQLTRDDISESGKLTSYLGRKQQVIPFYDDGSAEGKKFLLCSDGLYKTLDARELQGVFRELTRRNLRKSAEKLAELAIQRGERDNISVALIIQES